MCVPFINAALNVNKNEVECWRAPYLKELRHKFWKESPAIHQMAVKQVCIAAAVMAVD